MEELAYPDLLERWWEAHGATPPGWEPPTEPVVRAWGRAVLTEVVVERWDAAPPRAGDSRPPDRDVVDLRALAQTPIDPPKHWLEIRVIDDDDAPVAGVKVTLVRPDGARERSSTDDDGVARWRKLPSGRARVIFDDDAAVFAEVG